MKTAEVVKFDDLIRAGRDTDALRYFAQEYYDNGKMGHTRKLLIERAAERIEALQAELAEIKTDQNSFIGHQNQVIEKLEQSLRAKMDTDKVLNRLVESLQIKLAESQRRERAAVEDLCGACEALTRATGHGWEDSCYKCQWWRGVKEERE